MIGDLTLMTFVPARPMDAFAALPIQTYNWCDQPEAIFQRQAAAGILVLRGILLPMNAVTVVIRGWHQRKKAW